jgi:hypothetical protein
LCLQSTMRPKLESKSALMSGCVTTVTMNRHVNSRRNPRLRLSGQPSVSADGSAVSRSEVVVDTLPALWNQLAGVNAEVRARVDQEPLLSGFVGDKEAGGGCSADIRRR